MKNKVVVVAVIVFLGTLFGGMLNAVSFNKQMVRQQAELIDLMRTMAQQAKETRESVVATQAKVDSLDATLQKITNPVQQRQAPPQEDYTKVYDIPAGDSAVKGKADAPVTIVGFLDLQCPFSKKFQPMFDEAMKDYPQKVKYVVKHFPLGFHPQAAPAAKALMAAGKQGKFFEMMAVVLENNNQLSPEKFEELAKTIKLNVKQFKKDLEDNDKAWDEVIQKDMKLGTEVGVRGTPSFYINGRKTQARTVEAIKAEIDAVLAGL
ncbi:MAG TPA: thioredoxin domain-containing protein [Candidatus Bathyarchaeia archaeon]|nr:thioredoxin domain-containing protein [Candidatus Bathyarchaeia archaeon]